MVPTRAARVASLKSGRNPARISWTSLAPSWMARPGFSGSGCPRSRSGRQVYGLWLQMALITAAILCVGILIGNMFLRRITCRALPQLSKAAEEISGGRLDVQLASPAGMRSVGFQHPSTRWQNAFKTTPAAWKTRP